MTPRNVLRTGLVVLAGLQAFVGTWALPAPRSFYDSFPVAGHALISPLPPYNEHLIRDVGAYSLALAFVLGAAALSLERQLARIALLAQALFGVPHAIFHVSHLAGFPAADAVAQTVGMVLQLALTAGLFAVTWRLPPSPTG